MTSTLTPRARHRPGAAGVRPWATTLVLLLGIVLGSTVAQAAPVARTSGSGSEPPVLTLVPSPDTGSAPLAVGVTVSASGGTPPYTLSSVCFGDGTCATGLSGWNGDATSFNHVYEVSGTYSLSSKVTDAAGRNATSSARVDVTSGLALSVSVVASKATGSAPWGVDFTASVSGGTPPYTLQWNFGDGTQGSAIPGVAVDHVFSSSGTFRPVLSVSDAANHETSAVSPTILVNATSSSATSPSSAVPPALALVVVFLMVGVEHWRAQRTRREAMALLAALGREQGKP